MPGMLKRRAERTIIDTALKGLRDRAEAGRGDRDVTQQPGRSGQDPIGDFQRWLVRSGARSVSREVGGQLRSMLGYRGRSADVWETATTPTDEAPECAWCPVCRAARVLRESGPGVTSQMAAVGDVVTALAQDTMSVFEAALGRHRKGGQAGRHRARAGTVRHGLGGCGGWDGAGPGRGARIGGPPGRAAG
jgi:hypothetical protein